MFRFKGLHICVLVVIISMVDFTTSLGSTFNDPEWEAYKAEYGKNYTNTATTEAYARYYFNYNKRLIDNHNLYYERGFRTFKLRVNQFTDMRLISFNSLFPVTTPLTETFNTSLPQVNEPTELNFNPIEDLGFNSTVENQGTVCNSGWAYATAKAVELLKAYQSGQMRPQSLSAQGLIDCAGRSSGCTNQVPQTGFDYLSEYGQELYLSGEYPNKKEEELQGMCTPPSNPSRTSTIRSYGFINDNDDAALRRYVNAQYPVVTEFNPTSFEFMHYGEGVFQQPLTGRGSHFMTVIGYGYNTTLNLNYFLVQNSFNTTWGENGLIKIAYSATKPFTKSAILPII